MGKKIGLEDLLVLPALVQLPEVTLIISRYGNPECVAEFRLVTDWSRVLPSYLKAIFLNISVQCHNDVIREKLEHVPGASQALLSLHYRCIERLAVSVAIAATLRDILHLYFFKLKFNYFFQLSNESRDQPVISRLRLCKTSLPLTRDLHSRTRKVYLIQILLAEIGTGRLLRLFINVWSTFVFCVPHLISPWQTQLMMCKSPTLTCFALSTYIDDNRRDFNTIACDAKNVIEKDTSISHDDALALINRLEVTKHSMQS